MFMKNTPVFQTQLVPLSASKMSDIPINVPKIGEKHQKTSERKFPAESYKTPTKPTKLETKYPTTTKTENTELPKKCFIKRPNNNSNSTNSNFATPPLNKPNKSSLNPFAQSTKKSAPKNISTTKNPFNAPPPTQSFAATSTPLFINGKPNPALHHRRPECANSTSFGFVDLTSGCQDVACHFERRKVSNKPGKMGKEEKSWKMFYELTKTRNTWQKPSSKYDAFGGNIHRMERKFDENGNYTFRPISEKKFHKNKSWVEQATDDAARCRTGAANLKAYQGSEASKEPTKLENRSKDELIENVLDLGTDKRALEEIIEKMTAKNNNNEKIITNRQLKIKNVHISTTLEEMNTAIGMRNQAFTDVNTHLANFGLGHVDISATHRRKSDGRGYAILTLPNGGGVFQLDGRLAGRSGYNPESMKVNPGPNVKISNAETQTTEAADETADEVADEAADEMMEEEIFSQKPVPDDFKD